MIGADLPFRADDVSASGPGGIVIEGPRELVEAAVSRIVDFRAAMTRAFALGIFAGGVLACAVLAWQLSDSPRRDRP